MSTSIYKTDFDRVLVTGACGFIGTNLCLKLLEAGFNVTGIDSLTENYSRSIKLRNKQALQSYKNFIFIEEDLLEIDLSKLLMDKQVVFHLAGQPSVHNSWGEDFSVYSERNIILTQRLLRAALESGILKFIYASSSSVYGRVNSTPTYESNEKSPISPYGVTKLAAEHLVSLYGSEFGMNTVSLRYFTVYGPRQRPDMAFNKLIRAAQIGQSFPLHGDGTQIRDFTFVDDVVAANMLAAFSPVNPGSVFNIGGGSPISMNKVISMLEEIMDIPIKLEFAPLGPGNPMKTTADCSAANSILSWYPKTTLEHGLKAQVAWQLEQT